MVENLGADVETWLYRELNLSDIHLITTIHGRLLSILPVLKWSFACSATSVSGLSIVSSGKMDCQDVFFTHETHFEDEKLPARKDRQIRGKKHCA